jgi:DNA-binding beta-propeller fold protein YncE
MNKILIIGIGLFFAFSCKKDRPEEIQSAVEISSEKGLFIGSEGNFQFGNATLSFHDYGTNSTNIGMYNEVNGSPLGDVLQSMYQDLSSLYLIMNNAGKIEIVDKYNFKRTGTISGFTSPRYFLPVSNNKAYVTDLYSNSIQVVDLNQKSITKSIKTSGWTEEMVLMYGKAFVCNKAKGLLYIIDTSVDMIVDSIVVGDSPSSLRQDKNGKLWVLCQGSLGGEVGLAGLYQIDPVLYSVDKTLHFEGGNQPSKLRINGSNDTLYYLSTGVNNGVYRMDIEASGLPSTAFVLSENGANLYGLAVNPKEGSVFVSDAIDYLQKSKISRYNSKGELLMSFNTGVNTSSFLFLK